MVSIVQLVEHQIVVLGVVGSSPTGYPKWFEDDFYSHPLFFCLPILGLSLENTLVLELSESSGHHHTVFGRDSLIP